MKRTISTILLSVGIAASLPTHIDADKYPPKPTYYELKQYTVTALIEYYAKEYGAPLQKMHDITKCESRYNNMAHKYTPTGPNREDSWGPVQINLFAHPEVTKEQATDPVFAYGYLAKHLVKGDVNWTCNK